MLSSTSTQLPSFLAYCLLSIGASVRYISCVWLVIFPVKAASICSFDTVAIILFTWVCNLLRAVAIESPAVIATSISIKLPIEVLSTLLSVKYKFVDSTTEAVLRVCQVLSPL